MVYFAILQQQAGQRRDDRNHIAHRVGRGHAGQSHERMHSVQAGNQQRALAKNRDNRCEECISRCLQEITAEIIESKKRTGNQQPEHHLFSNCRIGGIFQEQSDQHIPPGKAAHCGSQAKTEGQKGGFPQDFLQTRNILRAVIIGKQRGYPHADAHLDHSDDHGCSAGCCHGGNDSGAVCAQDLVAEGGGKAGKYAADPVGKANRRRVE